MEWKKIIGAVSPVLGQAFGGPLVGMAVSLVADALGLSEKTEEAISQALADNKLSPDQIVAVKNAERQYNLEMSRLTLAHEQELAKTDTENTKSAREMQVASPSHIPGMLSYGLSTGFFGVLFYMLRNPGSAEGNEVILIMVGALGAGFGAVINYWFGSSYRHDPMSGPSPRGILDRLKK